MNFDQYIHDLVNRRDLPGGVLYIQKGNEYEFIQSYGTYVDQRGNTQTIEKDTIFDLASLTKVVATLPAILSLVSNKELRLTDSVQKFIPQFRFEQITIEHLLHHNSGLAADLSFKNRFEKRDVFSDLLKEDLIYETEEKVVYSDLGMILLGKIVEVISGERLDEFTKNHIFEPWKLYDTGYLPEEEVQHKIASTEKVGETFVQGEVHDEKAFHLGGVSGNAGLFSTAQDIGLYTKYWLGLEQQNIIPYDLLQLAHTRLFQHRGLGFEVFVEDSQSIACGHKWPLGTFGHTGFTGTSVWMDPIHQLSVVFLTNIVHLGRDHRMVEIRKELHTKIFEQLILTR